MATTHRCEYCGEIFPVKLRAEAYVRQCPVCGEVCDIPADAALTAPAVIDAPSARTKSFEAFDRVGGARVITERNTRARPSRQDFDWGKFFLAIVITTAIAVPVVLIWTVAALMGIPIYFSAPGLGLTLGWTVRQGGSLTHSGEVFAYRAMTFVLVLVGTVVHLSHSISSFKFVQNEPPTFTQGRWAALREVFLVLQRFDLATLCLLSALVGAVVAVPRRRAGSK
jgi:hypothetical protein